MKGGEDSRKGREACERDYSMSREITTKYEKGRRSQQAVETASIEEQSESYKDRNCRTLALKGKFQCRAGTYCLHENCAEGRV
jgi:hypothetical protein